MASLDVERVIASAFHRQFKYPIGICCVQTFIMTSSSDIISTLKKEINSVLISAGREITVGQLTVDYFDLIRKQIAFREAGYASLEEFLLSMPDALSTRWVNGELRLRAVTNELNGQIAKLVSLSKNKPKTKYRPKSPGQRSYHNNAAYATKVPSLFPDGVYPIVATTAKNNADFSMLRGEIISLMLCYKYGLKVSQFTEAYAKRFGNYKRLTQTAYPNVLELLKAMPDVVDIESVENSSDYIAHGKLGKKPRTGKH